MGSMTCEDVGSTSLACCYVFVVFCFCLFCVLLLLCFCVVLFLLCVFLSLVFVVVVSFVLLFVVFFSHGVEARRLPPRTPQKFDLFICYLILTKPGPD